MWERYAPKSLDFGFHEATFYRVVTTWYSDDIVSLLYSCFVQLDGVLFSKDKIDNLFRQVYETYNESLLSLDAVKTPLIRDSIFDESCWPLSASQKYSFEGFRDASFAFVAYYEKYRQELHQTHFKADVTSLVNSHVTKNLFYLYKNDRNAPLVVEALQHVAHCFMTNTFVLYGTVALQRYDNGYGFPDDKRSASPVYVSFYPTVYRYDAKRPADSFALSGTCEMRKKTKIALDGEEAKRRLAVCAAKNLSKVVGKCAGGLRKCPIEKKPVEEVPSSGPNTASHSAVASCSATEVTPTTTRKATRASSGSSKDSNVEDESKSTGLYVTNHDDELAEDFILLHGLSQDSFQPSNGEEDAMVRKARQVQH